MPTILTLVEKNANTCQFLDVSEEEHVKKEVVNYSYTNHFEPIILAQKKIETSVLSYACIFRYDKILRIIFSPPPNIC